MTERLARACARRPWRVLGGWLLAVMMSVVLIATFLGEALTNTAEVMTPTDSKRADQLLAQRRGSGPALLPSGSLQSYGGAIAAVGDDDTAFGHRDALVEFVAVAGWTDPAQARMAAARRYGAAVEPFASGVYVNDLTDEGQAGIRRAYGPEKLAWLAALKDRYDPGNLFHLNHNIRPTVRVQVGAEPG